MAQYTLTTPLTSEDTKKLKAGDTVLLNGTLFTARDAAHSRLVKLIEEGKELPFDIEGSVIYFVGPTPPKPGDPIGSAGPTTSYRMDPFVADMMKVAFGDNGLKDAEVKTNAILILKQYGVGDVKSL